jgi:pilus assembly protein FimV
LLRVFVDMGDSESARNTLQEIREEGTVAQQQEAEALFAELG